MEPELVIIGHIINETIQYPDRTITPVLGSPAAYSSVIASRLGIKTGLVTKIGKDWPDKLLQAIKDAKVDIRGVKVGDKSTKNLLIYDTSGNKRVHYLSKALPIYTSDIPREYLKAKIIYICPMDGEVPLETIEKLSRCGVTLAVDLMGYGGATSSWHPSQEEQEKPDFLKKLVGYFTIVKASDEDCRYLLGKNRTVKEAASFFLRWGAKIGIVTCGDKGAYLATENARYTIPSFKTKVVDLTGAGDAFSAGFLAEYLRTGEPLRSALFASATASCVIEGTGGVIVQRMPIREKVCEKINKSEYRKMLK